MTTEHEDERRTIMLLRREADAKWKPIYFKQGELLSLLEITHGKAALDRLGT